MKVPFFDLKQAYLEQSQEINSEILRVLNSGCYILGQECMQFEAQMATHLKSPGIKVVGCNSGTDAISLALRAIKIRDTDEVITVSHTAIPTVTAIMSSQCKPRLIDIDPQTWLIDLNILKNAINANTKAIVAVHLYGNIVDIDSIKNICRGLHREDIVIIEDVAQAQGAKFNNKTAGTIGDIGAFSFYPTKNLGALGDAGAAVSKKAHYIEALKMLRFYGQESRYCAKIQNGLNSRLDEVQAAVLKVRLKKFDSWLKIKEGFTNFYRSELKHLPITFQKVDPSAVPAWHLCVVRFESSKIRDSVQKFLLSRGIETLIHYPSPNHLQPAFEGINTYGELKNSEQLTTEILSLPMNHCLTQSHICRVTEELLAFFN